MYLFFIAPIRDLTLHFFVCLMIDYSFSPLPDCKFHEGKSCINFTYHFIPRFQHTTCHIVDDCSEHPNWLV